EPAIRFVMFATAWGSTHGGINSFNRDFAAALAQAIEGRIACVVPGASPEDEADASACGVILFKIGSDVSAEFDLGSAPLIPKLGDFAHVEFWIGHDIVTGEFAAEVKRAAKTGRLAVIMHQSYEDYASVKHVLGSTTEKAHKQRELFSKAD